jgi:ribose transport system permease protein
LRFIVPPISPITANSAMREGPTNVGTSAADGAEGAILAKVVLGPHRSYLLAAAVFLLLCVINAVLQPTFLSIDVAASNLAAFLPLTLLAIGQTYVVLGSDIDLSNGGIVSLVNVAVVELIEHNGQSGGSYAIGAVAGLAVGLIAGAFNGLCVAYLRFQPIVATFATGVIFVGLALWVLPQAGGQVPPAVYNVYAGATLGMPNVLITLVAAALFASVVARTRFYQALRAAGGAVQAAFYSGVPVERVRLTAYILSGLFAALAGLALVGETASGDPLIGGAMTLSSVTAVVLGGTSLAGCVGSVVGSILGSFILGLINNVIFFAHVPFEWQGLIKGAIILAALAGGVTMARRTTS